MKRIASLFAVAFMSFAAGAIDYMWGVSDIAQKYADKGGKWAWIPDAIAILLRNLQNFYAFIARKETGVAVIKASEVMLDASGDLATTAGDSVLANPWVWVIVILTLLYIAYLKNGGSAGLMASIKGSDLWQVLALLAAVGALAWTVSVHGSAGLINIAVGITTVTGVVFVLLQAWFKGSKAGVVLSWLFRLVFVFVTYLTISLKQTILLESGFNLFAEITSPKVALFLQDTITNTPEETVWFQVAVGVVFFVLSFGND